MLTATTTPSAPAYKITSSFTVNGRRYNADIEYCPTLDHAIRCLCDYAARESAQLSDDGRFATRCDGRHHTDWCIEPVYEENNQ